MQFYAHGYQQALELPIKTFWLMNGNIDRIQAQKDLRSLSRQVVAGSDREQITKFRESLLAEVGTIVKVEGDAVIHARMSEKRDEAGFAELKELSKLF